MKTRSGLTWRVFPLTASISPINFDRLTTSICPYVSYFGSWCLSFGFLVLESGGVCVLYGSLSPFILGSAFFLFVGWCLCTLGCLYLVCLVVWWVLFVSWGLLLSLWVCVRQASKFYGPYVVSWPFYVFLCPALSHAFGDGPLDFMALNVLDVWLKVWIVPYHVDAATEVFQIKYAGFVSSFLLLLSFCSNGGVSISSTQVCVGSACLCLFVEG